MADAKQTLEAFFAAYVARFASAIGEPPDVDVEGVAGAFANCFIEASPHGVNCGQNDEQFRTMIPQGFAFYRSIGTTKMAIRKLDITPLDELHWAVKVYYESAYRKPDGSEEDIDFEVIYLVQMIGEQPKIFAYITGDEQKLLRERGLIPG